MTIFRRLALRSGAAITTIALAVALTASAASAHIHVNTIDATAGAETGKLTFRVPTESDTASTTKITIDLPAKTLFADVTAETKPGWTATFTERKLDKPTTIGEFTVTKVVSAVTWTANGGAGIPPNQFDEFNLSVGPLPDKAGTELDFPATQTYSDGKIVTWDDPTPASGEEPENPIPALTLAAGTDDEHDHSDAATTASTTSSTNDADTAARTLGIVGIVVGMLGVGTAVAALRRKTIDA